MWVCRWWCTHNTERKWVTYMPILTNSRGMGREWTRTLLASWNTRFQNILASRFASRSQRCSNTDSVWSEKWKCFGCRTSLGTGGRIMSSTWFLLLRHRLTKISAAVRHNDTKLLILCTKRNSKTILAPGRLILRLIDSRKYRSSASFLRKRCTKDLRMKSQYHLRWMPGGPMGVKAIKGC